MKTYIALLTLVLAAGHGWAQCHKLGELNTATPEGQLLQQAGQESDNAKKLVLLEQFTSQYPQHEAIGWVDEQLLEGYVKANQADKALAMGEKLDAIPPDCVESAHQTLKAAELKKDPDQVRKWAVRTSELALKVTASPQPKDDDQVENWKARVDYAKQVNTYTEYSLYATALQSPDPAKQVALLEALQQRNPKSEYLAKATDALFVAYIKTEASEKALALAREAAGRGQAGEEMLLVLADDALQKKDAAQVYAYTAKVVEMVNAKPKPEGVGDADWAQHKNAVTGRARYLSGKQYYNEAKFAQADTDLRQALPVMESNVTVHAEILYLLGFANYKLDKVQEAAAFYKACAAVKSPFQPQAAKNLAALRAEYHGLK